MRQDELFRHFPFSLILRGLLLLLNTTRTRSGPPSTTDRPARLMHAHRFALFGLLGSLHAQNPCEPRVQAMYAAAGHPPVSCGNAEKEQMEVARRWKGTTPAHHRRWRNPKACPRETSFSTLEQLWPAGHFRGPLNGPRSYFRRVPPHFLGYHANFSNCRRKVYIDIGAKHFDSKEGFLSMLKLYTPLLDFDEYYGRTPHSNLPYRNHARSLAV